MDSREAYAVSEFCDRYGICRQTFYEEVRRGRLRALKLGKRTLVLRRDAENWEQSLPALKFAVTAPWQPLGHVAQRIIDKAGPR
jgi:excisionase family DNA binding protein